MICQGWILDKVETCTAELNIPKDNEQLKHVRQLAIDTRAPMTSTGVRLEECWRTLCTNRPWLRSSNDTVLSEAPSLMVRCLSSCVTTIRNMLSLAKGSM